MPLQVKLHLVTRKVFAIIAEEHQQVFVACRLLRTDFDIHRFHQRLLTHRLNDAACAKHRQPADNAQAWVKGFLGDFHACRNRNRHLQAASVAALCHHLAYFRSNHLARRRINRRTADCTGQARLRHTANAYTAFNHDSRLSSFFNLGINKHAISIIRVIA